MAAYKVAFIVVMFWSGLALSSKITLEQNGYRSIVVGISPAVDSKLEDKIIGGIKEVFRKASSTLYNATRQRSYFHDVTIVIPKSWPPQSHYDFATYENFADADIRVDLPNPFYGDGPYTLQNGGCMEPGKYIHLTPSYLINIDGNSTTIFGDPGKTFVHEWAHFRYGTFDEFGDPFDEQYPIAYYNEANQLIPNSCTNEQLKGEFRDSNDPTSPCNYMPDGKPDQYCVFIPNITASKATSSIGSFHYLPKVFSFCDETKEHKHNGDAPNKHNALCDGLSAWEVIALHEDFKGNKNPPTPITNIEIPNFRIVQQRDPVFVLVLDVSLSMKVADKINFLIEAVTRWLKYELQLGSAVGIITFGDNATVLQQIVDVKDEATRKDLYKKVADLGHLRGGQTCIGCGLDTALTVLKTQYGSGTGGIILLLTDGRESANIHTNIISVKPKILTSKVKIVTLAFTEEADSRIEELAQITGGKSFFINVNSQMDALNSAFYEFSTFQMTDKALSLKVHEEKIPVTKSVIGEFTIDDTIGKNTIIDFLYEKKDTIFNITISPSSQIKVAPFEQIPDPNTKLIRFKNYLLPAGQYIYNINLKPSVNEENIAVSVISEPRDKNRIPITTTCWMSSKIDPTKGTLIVIFAEVKQGQNPVINASVVAYIARPGSSQPIHLQLLDNGNGAPDITKNDGIYSRYFTSFSGKGRYSVKAQVDDKGLASILQLGFTASRAMPMTPNYKYPDLSNAKAKSTGKFKRSASGGSFQIQDEASMKVDFPPGQVRDLTVVNAWTNHTVTLKWTSPGEDLDSGIVSGYDIRILPSSADLRRFFETGTKVDTSQLKTLPAGEIIFFEFNQNSLKSPYYVALKAIDKSSQTSKISNVAQIYLAPSPPAPYTTPSKASFHEGGTLLKYCLVIVLVVLLNWCRNDCY